MIKIKQIYVSSFGRLKDFSVNLDDGLNIISRPNGFGKTTLANFVKAIFFGLNKTNGRKLGENERKKFMPWESAEKFGGYIKFEFNGKDYKAERYFGKTPIHDTFALYDGFDVPSDDFDENIGQRIFDIDAESFERCLYVPQKAVEVSANDSFLTKLNKLVDNTDDQNNFDTATKKLQDYYRGLVSQTRNKNASLKMQYQDKLDAARQNLYRARQDYDEVGKKRRAMDDNAKLLEASRHNLSELKEKQRQSDGKVALKNKAEVLLRVQTSCEQAKQRYDILKDKNSDVSEGYIQNLSAKVDRHESLGRELIAARGGETRAAKKTFLLWFLLSAVMAVVMAVAWGTVSASLPLLAGGIAIAAASAAAGAAGMLRARRKAAAVNAEREKVSALRDEYAEAGANLREVFACHKIYESNFHAALAQLKNNKAAFDEAECRYKEALAEWERKKTDPEFALAMSGGGLSARDYSREIEAEEHRITALTAENARLGEQVSVLLANADKISEFENQTERLQAKLGEVEDKAKLVETAIKCLEEAKTNLSKSFVPKIRDNFQRYIAQITEGQFCNVSVDDKFNLRIEEKNSFREFDYFSKGIMDIGVFCLRLSLIDAMYGETPPCLILDDPFVNFDDKKQATAMKLLGERAEKCQIVYFTCKQNF